MRISPSQVKTARTCLRKWGFKMLDGLKEPTTAAQEKGILGHARIEQYQKNSQHPGDDEMGKLVQQAMRPGYLPTPHPESLVEQHLIIDLGNGDVFHGYSDLITHPTVDDQGMPIVCDWKFTSNLRYAMSPDELKTDAQGVGYSKAAFDKWPDVPGVKNRWIYFDHKAKKVLPVPYIRSASQLADQWEELAAESRGLITLRRKGARAIDLKGNADACGDYGGCPFASHCDVPKRSSSFFGSKKQFTLRAENVNPANSSGAPALESEKQVAISLKEQLAQLKAQGAPAQAAPAAAPVATATPAPTGAGALAALQQAKGFTGVNPPAAQPAPTPAPAVQAAPATPAPTTAPATPAPGKISLKDQLAGVKPPAQAMAGQTPAPASVSPNPPVSEPVPPQGGSGVFPAPSALGPDATASARSQEELAVAAAETKKTRVKKAAPESAAPATAMSELSVLFNAVIMKHPATTARAVMLIDLLAPLMRKVADDAGKAHWSLIQYGEGKALLAHAFDKWLEESNWKGTIIATDNSAETFAVKEVLQHRADVVVGGLS